MHKFFSTCAAGVETIADSMACDGIENYTALRVLPGALLYEADEDLPKLPVFQNTYLVIAEYRANDTMDKAALRVLRDRQALENANRAIRARRFSSFRYMFSDANKLSAVNGGTRASLEKAISGARVDRVSPETELLILKRSEGIVLFLLRLTKREGTEKTLARGELSPAVAACMAHLVRPTSGGVFLDPFSGHGAIAQARIAMGPAKRLLLSDNDPEMVKEMQSRKKLSKPNVEIRLADAMKMREWVAQGSVSEISTDPPWGLFSPLPEPAPVFYQKMLAEFAWALAKGGRLCVLTADKISFEEAVAQNADFEFGARVDMLVNGKKAALYPAIRK